ncbi:hypothetical protein [Profundibacterium mesophilum]|uniref:Uncharacterized protein n=1 Tax=Profundibacterium mesophilum KAUST100406-0324 TaxID=1037889 RepID=A0A921NQR4_9RHOB|nr:hypothetical protein [Profundibacterium mesophilum]KAF0675740.1 hypothetical protein PMES_01826 [Profundibacterium mesophilum KAUST100406-0324]
MSPDDIAACFTGPDGTYRFARWGRPIAPVIFGVEESSLAVLKGAIEAAVHLAGHKMAETDPELGANLMIFFCSDWAELTQVPNLEKLLPGLGALVPRLEASGAERYGTYRRDEAGAIKASFSVLRMGPALRAEPAEDIALSEAARALLTWSETAFARRSVLARHPGGATVLAPHVAALIRAAYDPVMPVSADDPSHALRLAARVSAAGDARNGDLAVGPDDAP